MALTSILTLLQLALSLLTTIQASPNLPENIKQQALNYSNQTVQMVMTELSKTSVQELTKNPMSSQPVYIPPAPVIIYQQPTPEPVVIQPVIESVTTTQEIIGAPITQDTYTLKVINQPSISDVDAYLNFQILKNGNPIHLNHWVSYDLKCYSKTEILANNIIISTSGENSNSRCGDSGDESIYPSTYYPRLLQVGQKIQQMTNPELKLRVYFEQQILETPFTVTN